MGGSARLSEPPRRVTEWLGAVRRSTFGQFALGRCALSTISTSTSPLQFVDHQNLHRAALQRELHTELFFDAVRKQAEASRIDGACRLHASSASKLCVVLY